MKTQSILVLLGLFHIGSSTIVNHTASPNPTVSLPAIKVIGTVTSVGSSAIATAAVNAYLGVPFAQTPPQRFSPPLPLPIQDWTKIVVAQSLPPACIQQFGGVFAGKTWQNFGNPNGPPLAESEDCLYLNIFAPHGAGPNAQKPVFFYIFGGNLQSGSGSVYQTDGASMAANQDIVVVVINHRTNIFGFSNSPEIPLDEQNIGFLDQRLALQWVQENIAAFGGDPTKVTIAGQSSGGFSVKQLLAFPPSPSSFRAAIMQSQGATLATNSSQNWRAVVSHFDCDNVFSPLDCMRNVPSVDLVTYIEQQGYQFSPVQDNVTMTRNTRERMESGQVSHVPILIGTNHDDTSFFLYNIGIENRTGADYSNIVRQLPVLLGGDPASGDQFLADVLRVYNATSADYRMLDRLFTDAFYTCTTSIFSNAIAVTGLQPIWRYSFDGVYANTQYYPSAGAWHSSEIPLIFGTYPRQTIRGNASSRLIESSERMQALWANFVKDPTSLPWSNIGNDTESELGHLGTAQGTWALRRSRLDEVDYPCEALLNPLLLRIGQGY